MIFNNCRLEFIFTPVMVFRPADWETQYSKEYTGGIHQADLELRNVLYVDALIKEKLLWAKLTDHVKHEETRSYKVDKTE